MKRDDEMERVFTPEPPSLLNYLRQVWDHRRLIVNLSRRNLKVKYAQTKLGVLWVILQPLTGMVIFTLFFEGLFDLFEFDIDTPYYLFAYCGYSTWVFFVYVVQGAGTALLQDESLIKRVFFPKMVLPISRALIGLSDYGLSLAVLLLMALVSGNLAYVNLFLLPFAVILTVVVSMGIAVWLAALTIRHRDFVHLIPYLVNFGIWLSPVFYPTTIIPSEYHFLIYFNPMAGIVELTRWSVLGTPLPSVHFIWSFAVALIVLISGVRYFLLIENEISDHV